MVNICGIGGIHILNPENAPKYSKMENAIDQLLIAIDNRGGDATGFVAIGEDNIEWQKASCNAFEFYKERRSIPYNTRSVLLHTRMATQGSAAFPENNHPVRRGSVYVVHNGHVWNDREIFKKTKRERYGQVDSEAIAAVIAKYGIMNTHKAMEEISGAAAIGVVDTNRPGIMVLARGSMSPLMFYKNEDVAVFASTKEAIKKAWNVLYGTSPKDKKIEDVKEGEALYLNGDVERKRFVQDDYYGYKSYSINSSYNHCDINSCWISSVFTTLQGERLCQKHKDEYLGDIGHKITISSYNGSKGTILCAHGCEKEECEICNPDDKHGSYLPVRIKDARNEWVDAKQCDLCDNWFADDELSEVNDWQHKTFLCDSCMDELSEVIADCDITRPTRIHEENLEDMETINEYLNRQNRVSITI